MFASLLSLLLLLSIVLYVQSFLPAKSRISNKVGSSSCRFSIASKATDEEFEQMFVLKHLGEYQPSEERKSFEEMQRELDFNLNLGRAMETLRRELPMAFHISDLDMSIFANQITVCTGNAMNKISMAKPLYTAAVKSLRVASAVSFTQPYIDVMKIEYIEDCRTIQCRVDVVFPDTVRVDGQCTWEGMFYFGLDRTGKIETHIFDRKVTTKGTNQILSGVLNYPWLQNAASAAPWNQDLIKGSPVPQYAAETDNTN